VTDYLRGKPSDDWPRDGSQRSEPEGRDLNERLGEGCCRERPDADNTAKIRFGNYSDLTGAHVIQVLGEAKPLCEADRIDHPSDTGRENMATITENSLMDAPSMGMNRR